MSNDAPGLRAVYDESLQYGIHYFIFFALAAMIFSLWQLATNHNLKSRYKLLIAWGILPPTWFVIEYFFIFIPYGKEGSFGFFQYGQSIASKLWGAMFALISINLYKLNEKEKEKEKNKSDENPD